MDYISIIVLILYLAVLSLALILLADHYICDTGTCSIFTNARERYPENSVGYYDYILRNVSTDGIAPLPLLLLVLLHYSLSGSSNLLSFFPILPSHS